MIMKQVFIFLLMCIAQIAYGKNVTTIVDGRYVNKLPIYVTGLDESEKVELEVRVPKGLCQASLVKRVDNGFYKKEYMACEDLKKRESNKMFFILYNIGQCQQTATELIDIEKDRLSHLCSEYTVLHEESSEGNGYAESEMIFSCSDIKTKNKVVMLMSFFSEGSDCSGFSYNMKMGLEDPNDFAIGEMIQNINDDNISIYRGGVKESDFRCCKKQ